MSTYNYLALGDSYTIGEGLPPEDNFPNQVVKILEEDYNINCSKPEIIATTGWTTDELQKAIEDIKINPNFGLVTLLIGVNNQYRNRSIENFKLEFSALLKQAIAFAGMNYKRVIVLSIPDWGHTPFAKEKGIDEQQVTNEINSFNEIIQEITLAEGVRFLDITSLTKNMAQDINNLTQDGLHYAATVYKEWSECVAALSASMLR
ncbi:MAG TPA: GDSL-type esterase/lipase family protein [Edaphocola sp.]|nr:GDSL-type esterase/lipase family protein [Edaphocola sp.]